MRIKFVRLAAASAAVAAVLGWSQANATMITANTPTNGEPSIYQIMNQLYGVGNWAQGDQEGARISSLGTYNLQFDVRYAANEGMLGYTPNGTTTPTGLMSFTGSSATPLAASLSEADTHGAFQFTYQNLVTGEIFSQDPTKNVDGRDHVLVFWVGNQPNMAPGSAMGVIAWEDQIGGDWDFNDAVIQLIVTPIRNVPEPAGLAVLGAALMGFGMLRRRKQV